LREGRVLLQQPQDRAQHQEVELFCGQVVILKGTGQPCDMGGGLKAVIEAEVVPRVTVLELFNREPNRSPSCRDIHDILPPNTPRQQVASV
jgi:hypothetical protein